MQFLKILLLYLLLLSTQLEASNPFAIHFPSKKELTVEDYTNIQNQLRSIDIKPLVDELYSEFSDSAEVNWVDFYLRCSKGLRQTLVSPEQGLFPQRKLEKIGDGGKRCIVCCVPYNSDYPSLVSTISQALQETGFNGYFYYLIGGFPNPTGIEAQFIGIPYCFKIFTMMEAQQLGFTSVLWIDSALMPLRNPDPLFEIIDKYGAYLSEENKTQNNKYIFPRTRLLLKELTGTDVFETTFIRTHAFGMKMDSDLSQKFIELYYQMLLSGLPFLSCFPEEFVFTAIAGREEFKDWKGHVMSNVLSEHPLKPTPILSFESPELSKKSGVFFYYRGHL